MQSVQLNMALAALGWGTRDLAAASKVSLDTIARFKRGEQIKPRTIDAMRMALEAAGVEFIPENGGGSGVRLRKPKIAERGANRMSTQIIKVRLSDDELSIFDENWRKWHSDHAGNLLLPERVRLSEFYRTTNLSIIPLYQYEVAPGFLAAFPNLAEKIEE